MSLDPKSPSMKLWHRLLAAGASEDEATELMHGYAHELAGRIRGEKGATSLESGHHFFSGMDYAADIIDPQEQQPPVDEYRLSTRPRIVGGGS
ncbi:hypothetical protein OHV08_34390 [Streptomyces canus]|uniref:hypothetical protein n=1 Tax=Streptomyces canus TaxID=58343 RepID=UPI00324719B3